MAQTTDGNLCVGTESGLYSFDGVRFIPWNAPDGGLADQYINALEAEPSGGLWIGGRKGLGLWKDGRLTTYPTSLGGRPLGVTAILAARNGTVWVGLAGYRSGGLCRVVGKALECEEPHDGLPHYGAISLLEDRAGHLWVGDLGISRWGTGPPHAYRGRDLLETVYSIAEAGPGEIFIATRRDGGLERLARNEFVPYPLGPGGSKIRPSTLLEDRDGGLWIGTVGQGLLHLCHGRIDRVTQSSGLSSDDVRRLFEDREGNIWVATDAGLDQFHDRPATTITTHQGLSENRASSVFAGEDGSVWIGTASGLNRLTDGKITIYGKRDGLPSESILFVFQERSGRVWASTGAGLAYSDGGPFHSLDSEPAGKGQLISAMTEDRDGCLWLSDPAQGLIRLRNLRIVDTVPWTQFNGKRASAIETDPSGHGIWLGFVQGEVAHYEPGRGIFWQSATERSGPVTDLHFARDGTLLVATSGGLVHLSQDSQQILTRARGLPCDNVVSMVEDNRGALWLYTACGLVRIEGQALAGWAMHPENKIQVRLYDDGMPTFLQATGYSRRSAKSRDGRLWFAVMSGVAVLDPARLTENRLPPPVAVESVAANHKLQPLGGRIELPPHTRELEIDYAAFSFANPGKVRFRYKLEGIDTEWTDAGGSRRALYTNLPPRSYQFHVIACNNDGVWNNTGASLAFSIAPAFYQTSLFRWLCAAVIALILWSLHYLRVRFVAARLKIRFDERLAERSRIAGEMHDTLAQNLAGIALQLEGLSKTLSGPARDGLRDLRGQAERCLREAREILWDLRAPLIQQKDLFAALTEAGEEITAGAPVQLRATLRGESRPAPAKLQQQLVRIVQEATRNAIRHGDAKQIEMDVAYLDANSISVRMRDDGRGFNLNEASGRQGHWGLATMRERAARIGAELRISTAPGSGTEIEICAHIPSSKN